MWKEFADKLILKFTGFIIQSKEVATTESITLKELSENNELIIPERFYKTNSAVNSRVMIMTNHPDIVSYVRFLVLLNAKLDIGKEFDPFAILNLESTQVLWNRFFLSEDAYYIDEVVAIRNFKASVSLLVTNTKRYYSTDISDGRKRVMQAFLKQLNNTIIEIVKVSLRHPS